MLSAILLICFSTVGMDVLGMRPQLADRELFNLADGHRLLLKGAVYITEEIEVRSKVKTISITSTA